MADQLLAERTCEALADRRSRPAPLPWGDRRPVRLWARAATTRNTTIFSTRSNAVLAGREVSPETTQVVGCPIERTMPQKTRRQWPASGLERQGNASVQAEQRPRRNPGFLPAR